MDCDIYLFYCGLAAFAIVVVKRTLGSPLFLMEVVRLDFSSGKNVVKRWRILTRHPGEFLKQFTVHICWRYWQSFGAFSPESQRSAGEGRGRPQESLLNRQPGWCEILEKVFID